MALKGEHFRELHHNDNEIIYFDINNNTKNIEQKQLFEIKVFMTGRSY